VTSKFADLSGSRPRDVEVELRFLTTAEGGRKVPAFPGYRPQFYYDGRDWDAVHEYPDVERVDPGDTVRAYLAFLSPHEHLGKLVPGKAVPDPRGATSRRRRTDLTDPGSPAVSSAVAGSK
jgi:hypothetical protein